jgi:hypothetical protein
MHPLDDLRVAINGLLEQLLEKCAAGDGWDG